MYYERNNHTYSPIQKNKLVLIREETYNCPTTWDTYNYVIMLNKLFGCNKLKREYTYVIALGDHFKPIGILQSSPGEKNNVSVNYDDISNYLDATNSFRFISAHNHPSGDAMPSRDDIDILNDLRYIFGPMLYDALIIGDTETIKHKFGIYSFADTGYFRCVNTIEHFHGEYEEYLNCQINELTKEIEGLEKRLQKLECRADSEHVLASVPK